MNSKQTFYLLITIVAMCVLDDKNNVPLSARWKKEFLSVIFNIIREVTPNNVWGLQ